MKTPGTPYIASVSHEAGSYGPRLIQLGLGILKGKLCLLTITSRTRLVTATSLAKRAGRQVRVAVEGARGQECDSHDTQDLRRRPWLFLY